MVTIQELRRKIKKLRRKMAKTKKKKPKKTIMQEILDLCEQLAQVQGRFNKKIFKEVRT